LETHSRFSASPEAISEPLQSHLGVVQIGLGVAGTDLGAVQSDLGVVQIGLRSAGTDLGGIASDLGGTQTALGAAGKGLVGVTKLSSCPRRRAAHTGTKVQLSQTLREPAAGNYFSTYGS